MSRRILHITTLLQGGAGRIVAELACAQQRAGHRVAVACAAEGVAGYEHYPAWHARLAAHGVPVLPVHCTFRRSPAHLTGAVTALERSDVVRAGIDVVHAHAAVPALVARTLRPHVPVLATMHGWNAEKSAEHAAADVAVYNALPVVAVPSEAAGRHLVDAGVQAHRLCVVPYGVEPQAVAGGPSDAATVVGRWRQQGRLVLACVGSVGARKRQMDLLDALTVPTLRDCVACVFVGEAGDMPAWTAAVTTRGLEAAVSFLGRRDDVSDWISMADAVVFPSGREGLPIALLETAALGRPVVASDIPEHRGIVDDGVSGLLYSVGNVEALASALLRLRAMPDAERRRLGRGAHARWAADHQPAAMHARYADLYERVTRQAAAPMEACPS